MNLDPDSPTAEYVEYQIRNRTLTQDQQDMVDETINVLTNMFHPSPKQLKQMTFFVITMLKSTLLVEDTKRGL